MTLTQAKHVFGKMPARIKELWLTALRSGEYKQVCGKMRVTTRMEQHTQDQHGVGHCCLGVLTEIAKAEGHIGRFEINKRNQKLTTHVQQWAGIPSEQVTKLITMNDGGHDPKAANHKYYLPENRRDNKNFSQIADWVEENL